MNRSRRGVVNRPAQKIYATSDNLRVNVVSKEEAERFNAELRERILRENQQKSAARRRQAQQKIPIDNAWSVVDGIEQTPDESNKYKPSVQHSPTGRPDTTALAAAQRLKEQGEHPNESLLSKLSKNALQAVLHVPLSNNLGPGNKIQEGVNPTDTGGEKHDYSYGSATSLEDYKEADKVLQRFTGNRFAELLTQGSDPIELYHNVLTRLGIGIKQISDKAVGQIYTPSSISGKNVFGIVL